MDEDRSSSARQSDCRQSDFFDASPAPPTPLRVLACLRPDAALREGLGEAVRTRIPNLEITRPERLHLTLMVWPRLHPDLLAPLRARLADILFSPFELGLGRLEVWPRNRIAVALPADQDPASLLFAQVRAASRRAGLHGQGRSPDLAHVTLSRSAGPRHVRWDLTPIPWRCRGFDLVYSPPYREPYALIEHFPAR